MMMIWIYKSVFIIYIFKLFGCIMKRLGFLFVLVIVLMSSFVLAEISISEPLNIYNLGDRLHISVDGLVGSENGNFKIELACGNRTINLVKIPARAFSIDEALSYPPFYKILNGEDLESENVSEIVGDCQVIASIGSSVASTKTFSVSDNVSVAVSLDKA